jgi:DNA-binding NarL/FixJ family response regulator
MPSLQIVTDDVSVGASVTDRVAGAHDVAVIGVVSPPDATATAATWAPDVVIIALAPPEAGLTDLVAALATAQPASADLLLTGLGGDACFAALSAGARGCLPADADGAVIAAAVTDLAHGGVTIDAGLARRVRDSLQPPGGRRHRADQVTAREAAVLDLLAQGISNGDVAIYLGIPPRAVGNHVANALARVQTLRRAAALVATG